MFCPECDAEFVAGITTCSDCDVPLVSTGPENEGQEDRDEFLEVPEGPLVRVPLVTASDAALVQSLLRAAGFPYHVNPGFGGDLDEVFVREKDVPDIKEFFDDYRSQQGWSGERLPIPW